MNWTKELPKESGYYWYREPSRCTKTGMWGPDVVEWDTEMQWLQYTGNDIPSGADFSNQIIGEFWPERLTPPPA